MRNELNRAAELLNEIVIASIALFFPLVTLLLFFAGA
jgi:hypothetical protein